MPLGLEADVWLYVAGATFVATHLAVLVYLARRNLGPTGDAVGQPARSGADVEARSDGAPSDDLPPIEGEAVVRCPHCSVENLADFRFCRYCVGELTGGTAVAEPSGAKKDGQAF